MAVAASELVSRAKAQVENPTPEQVVEEIAAGALVVDLREPGELANDGMIEDAVHAPWGMLELWADPSSPYHRPEFDPRRRTVLYCASGGRSALGARDPRTARVHREPADSRLTPSPHDYE